MVSFSDFTQGAGGDNSTAALDELAKALSQLDLKGLVKGTDALTTAQVDLHQQLKLLKSQAEENVKATTAELTAGRISGKKARKILDQQVKATEELNQIIEEETKGKIAGVREFNKLTDVAQKVNKEFEWTRKNLRQNRITEAQWYKEQARRAKAWATATDRIEETTEGLDNLSSKLGSGFLGQGVIGAARGAIQARSSGKDMGRGAKMAIGGLAAVAAVGAALGAAIDIRQKALAQVAPKIFNVGLQGAQNLETAMDRAVLSTSTFRKEANLLGIDGETVDQVFTDISTTTSAANADIVAAGDKLFRAVQTGMIPAGDAAAYVSERFNTVGMSVKDAAAEVFDLGVMARSTKAIHMDDFVESVREVGGAMNALTTDQRALGKGMAFLAKQGDKLNLTYNRTKEAAKGLLGAVTNNYDQGFATIEVEEDLAVAMRAREKLGKNASKAEIEQADQLASGAAEIQKLLEENRITQVTAARMFKEIGGTTSTAVQGDRLERLALDIEAGGVELAQARVGELSLDQIGILEGIGKQVKEGKSVEDAMTASGVTAAQRASLMSLSDKAAKASYTSASLMNATVDDLMSNLAALLGPIVAPLKGFLKDISTSMRWLSEKLGMSDEDIAKRDAKAKKEKAKEEIADTMSTLSMAVGEATGDKSAAPWYMTDESMQIDRIAKLADDPTVQAKYAETFNRAFTDKEKDTLKMVLGDEKSGALIDKFEDRRGGSRYKDPASIEVTKGGLGADGIMVGEATLRFTDKTTSKVMEQKANVAEEDARASSRTGR